MIVKKNYLYAFLAIVLSTSVVYSQESSQQDKPDNETQTQVNEKIYISVDKAVTLAIENNKEIKQTYYDFEIAKIQKDQTFADLFLPSLSISGGMTLTKENELTGGLKSSMDRWSAQADLSKVVFTGFRYINADKRQAINLKIVEDKYNEALKDLAINTKLSFYNTFLLQEGYRVYLRSQSSLSNRMYFLYQQYRNGMASEYQYLNAKVQYENTKPNIIKLSNDYESLKLSFLLSMGITNNINDVEFTGNLMDATKIVIPNIPYEEMLAKIMENNIELKIMEMNIDMLEYNRKIANSFYWPTISAFGGVNISLNDKINTSGVFPNVGYSKSRSWEPGWNAGVKLSYSLDSLLPFSAVSKKAQEVDVNLQKLKIGYEHLRDQVEVYSRGLIATSQSQYLMLVSQEENAKTAAYAYAMAERQYQGGTISTLEVSDAEVTYLDAELAYLKSIHNYYLSTLQIMKLLGSDL